MNIIQEDLSRIESEYAHIISTHLSNYHRLVKFQNSISKYYDNGEEAFYQKFFPVLKEIEEILNNEIEKYYHGLNKKIEKFIKKEKYYHSLLGDLGLTPEMFWWRDHVNFQLCSWDVEIFDYE